MKKYILLGVIPFLMSSFSYKIDFGNSCVNCDWFVVVDGVMGGLSKGTLETKDDSILFSGSISLANNGGFASVRTPYSAYDLSPYTSVKVRYRSTGQDFGLTLNKYRQFWRPQYKANLEITNGEWREVEIPLKDFGMYRLGNKVTGRPDKEDLSKIVRLGLISNTKKASDFEFEVDYILFE